MNNITLDSSPTAAPKNPAMFKGKSISYEESHRACDNHDPLDWRTEMKFIWASKIRIGCYREGFVHNTLDVCSCPFEISVDLKSFIVGQ